MADLRDYRLSNDSTTAAAFARDVTALGSRFVFAQNSPNIVTPVPTTAPASPVGVSTTTLVTSITGLSEDVVFTATLMSTPTIVGAATLLPTASANAAVVNAIKNSSSALQASISLTMLALLAGLACLL